MTKQQIINEITTAFQDVKLEDGIGLLEGNGLDDWLSGDELQPLRQQDERENWQNIPFEHICGTYESAFSYIDAKGMRFLMPQYLIADILSEELQTKNTFMTYCPTWRLDEVDKEYGREQFKLFNKQQIQAVIHYLEYNIQLEIEENKKYGVTEANNRLLYEQCPTLRKWKKLLKDKEEGEN